MPEMQSGTGALPPNPHDPEHVEALPPWLWGCVLGGGGGLCVAMCSPRRGRGRQVDLEQYPAQRRPSLRRDADSHQHVLVELEHFGGCGRALTP